MPDPGEDADAPIVVPRPGQILRRTARTKIRKQGQTGEGAHRFNATRRGAGSKRTTPPPPPVPDPRSSSDLSSDHDLSDAESLRHRRLFSNESVDGTSRSDRPESYSAEAFIFDAYARDDINDGSIRVISPPPLQPLPRHSLSPPTPPASQEVPEPVPPIQVVPPAQPTPVLPPLQHPLPQRASSLGAPASGDTPSRSPSPVTTVHSDLSSARPESRPVQTPSTSSPTALQTPQGSDSRREKEKDKDKKGLFKWGGGEKKGKKDQREKEKDPGFFGALFGSKKKPEESVPVGLAHAQSGREAAVALLGASKSSRGYVPPASPQPQGVNNYSRYPIHVERAIYRLSHIKLANPRRALYEQVLISNLMFWYLGVINKTQQPQSQQQQPQQQQGQTPTEQAEALAHGQAPAVTGVSGPQKEREENERAEVEQAESERGEAKFTTQGQTQAQQASPQGRRGSLTKAAPVNAGPRRAEQPVRGPQYDMQHRAMEQEYGAAFVGGARSTAGPPGIGYAAPPPGAMQIQVSMSMSGSVPSAATAGALPSQQLALAAAGPRRSHSPPPPAGSGVRYVPPPPSIPPPPALPQPQAQAMPTSTSNSASPNISPSAAHQVSLTSMEAAPARVPGRSLSANATPQLMGQMQSRTRKAQSARAVVPSGPRRPRMSDSPVEGHGEEEDVPLALWQQQQQSLLSQQPRRR
jgi:Activator of mitotic machinery Cdc14 phosphatase activation C-term